MSMPEKSNKKYHVFLKKDKRVAGDGKVYVYLLFHGRYSDRNIMSVHDTLEKAEAEALTYDESLQDEIDIVEEELL